MSEGGTSSPSSLSTHQSFLDFLFLGDLRRTSSSSFYRERQTEGFNEGRGPLVAKSGTATVTSSPRQPQLLMHPSLPSPLRHSPLHHRLLEEWEEKHEEECQDENTNMEVVGVK